MDFPYIKKTFSPAETEECGRELAMAQKESSELPRFVAMFGDLGVGKTAFTRGFTSVFSPSSAVKSPTFTLVNEYGRGRDAVFHFDMYRIDSEDDLYSIGFYDYLDRGGVCIVEWSEKIPFALPREYIKVLIEKHPDGNVDDRTVSIELIS